MSKKLEVCFPPSTMNPKFYKNVLPTISTPSPIKRITYNENFNYPSGTYEDDKYTYFIENDSVTRSYHCSRERKRPQNTVAQIVIPDMIAQYIECDDVDGPLPLIPYIEDCVKEPEIVLVNKLPLKKRIKLDVYRVFMPFPNYLWEHREVKIGYKLPPRGCIIKCKYIFPRLNCQEKNPTQNLEIFFSRNFSHTLLFNSDSVYFICIG